MGRLGERSFTLDAAFGRDVLVSLTQSHPEIAVHGEHIAGAPGRLKVASGATSLEALLVQLAAWADRDGRGISLRQGAFEARRPIDLEGFAHWKRAGAIAAVLLFGWFGWIILETNAMNARATQLEALTQEFANVGWPELGGDVRQALAASSRRDVQDQSFPSVLDASALLYDALAQVEGSELRSLRYDRMRRQLTASIAFESFADVDRLTTVLNQSGLVARSGDSRQSGSRVIGDLTLESAS